MSSCPMMTWLDDVMQRFSSPPTRRVLLLSVQSSMLKTARVEKVAFLVQLDDRRRNSQRSSSTRPFPLYPFLTPLNLSERTRSNSLPFSSFTPEQVGIYVVLYRNLANAFQHGCTVAQHHRPGTIAVYSCSCRIPAKHEQNLLQSKHRL